jgi:hypothetical protein
VIRPLLDISISYLDSDDEIVFDNLRPLKVKGTTCRNAYDTVSIIYSGNMDKPVVRRPWLWLPYTPHTIGKADFYRTMAARQWLLDKRKKRVK